MKSTSPIMLIFYPQKYILRNTSSFKLKLSGENNFAPLNINPTNLMQINKSNAKVSIHYRVRSLYSENICCDILAANKSLNFFQNVFSTKAIQVCHTITIPIQNYLVNTYWFVFIEIYYAVLYILHSVLENRFKVLSQLLVRNLRSFLWLFQQERTFYSQHVLDFL